MAIPQPQVPSNNFLVDLIPVTQRKRAYALYGLLGMLIGLAWVVVAAIVPGLPPVWLTALVVGYNFLTPFFGALAAANAVPTGAEAADADTTVIEVDSLPVEVNTAEYQENPERVIHEVRQTREQARLPEDGSEDEYLDYDADEQFPDIARGDDQ